MLVGLCSVTFRTLEPTEVIDVAARAGVDVIEWGGDVHVPPAKASPDEAIDRANRVRDETASAGIVPGSYGSYLRTDPPPPDQLVEGVCATARAAGATNLRVWATGDDVEAVAATLGAIATTAFHHGLTVGLEYHPGTRTETAAGAAELLARVSAGDGPGVDTYWQPDPKLSDDDNLQALTTVLPWLRHLHVFRWDRDGGRLPLASGESMWRSALDLVREHDRSFLVSPHRVAFLEFVPDDDPAVLAGEVATLRSWVA